MNKNDDKYIVVKQIHVIRVPQKKAQPQGKRPKGGGSSNDVPPEVIIVIMALIFFGMIIGGIVECQKKFEKEFQNNIRPDSSEDLTPDKTSELAPICNPDLDDPYCIDPITGHKSEPIEWN